MHDIFVEENQERGGAVVRKVARDEADVERLAHEAMMLAAARHPGVVELVADSTGDSEVVTAFVGSHSLETIPRLSTEQVARTVASLADTVADLHALGIVHGRIERSHVLVGERGRPVLCGFAGAALIGDVPRRTLTPCEIDDPAHPLGTPATTSLDSFGLGALLRSLLSDDVIEAEPIPERRVSLDALRRPWVGYRSRALLTLADHATADEPLRRPSPRRLAASIREAVPGCRETPIDDVRSHQLRPEARRTARRVGTLGATALGLALLLFGAGSLRGGGGTSPSAAAASTTEGVDSTCPPSPASPAVDLDGDGCAEATASVDGTTIVAGAQRFDVGQPGDVVALGDWDCNGTSDVAILRRADGAVFTFGGWAVPGVDVTATPAGNAPGAVALQPGTEACARLAATYPDGSTAEVHP